MYTISWNYFPNLDKGSHPQRALKQYKKEAIRLALEVSSRLDTPGVVTVIDKQGKQVAAYQQGKAQVRLFE